MERFLPASLPAYPCPCVRACLCAATVSFARAGIDKPDVRRVVNWGPSKGVEEYARALARVLTHLCHVRTWRHAHADMRAPTRLERLQVLPADW
jgi:hypothetical protein